MSFPLSSTEYKFGNPEQIVLENKVKGKNNSLHFDKIKNELPYFLLKCDDKLVRKPKRLEKILILAPKRICFRPIDKRENIVAIDITKHSLEDPNQPDTLPQTIYIDTHINKYFYRSGFIPLEGHVAYADLPLKKQLTENKASALLKKLTLLQKNKLVEVCEGEYEASAYENQHGIILNISRKNLLKVNEDTKPVGTEIDRHLREAVFFYISPTKQETALGSMAVKSNQSSNQNSAEIFLTLPSCPFLSTSIQEFTTNENSKDYYIEGQIARQIPCEIVHAKVHNVVFLRYFANLQNIPAKDVIFNFQ